LTGTYSVTAMGTFSTGCTSAGINTLVITVNSTPVAGFSVTGASPFTASTAVTFTNTSFGSNNTYMWSFDDGTSSTLINDSHTYSNAGNYCVKLVATNSVTLCRDSTTHCIDVTAPMSISIPNVFTPNNDGTNDVFKASGIGIPQFHCAIFDRWGLKMYEWDGINGSWDGKTKTGDVVPSGTYFYFINYTGVDGTSKQVNGDLTLYK
ncbi:MAG: T9SS type B sorting domain-containing protein, partial [Bacteroidia bacterium]